jgi:ABC-2 type transport system ATP-binding protein
LARAAGALTIGPAKRREFGWPFPARDDIFRPMPASVPECAIRVDRLAKRFGKVTAVDELTFDVRAGDIVGLLGGNGAGKTTTISMLLGLLTPSAGALEVLGVDMLRRRYEVLPRLNFSSPYVDLPKRLTARENLTVYANLYGVADVKGRLAQVAGDLDIGGFLDRPYGELSSGQKTRISLAKSLLNEPELLLLDEPTASLDPDTADLVRGYLKEFQVRRGATLLLASHNMAEVERLCDQVLMMKQGRIVDRGSPKELLSRYGRQNLEDVFLDIARNRPRAEATAAQ